MAVAAMETILKICRKCKQQKPIDRFQRSKLYKCGHRAVCKDCDNEKVRQNRKLFPEKYRKWARDARQKNPELYRKQSRERRKLNLGKYRAKAREYRIMHPQYIQYEKEYRASHREIYRQSHRKWWEKHGKAYNANPNRQEYYREWYLQNIDKLKSQHKEWIKNNPGKSKEYSHRHWYKNPDRCKELLNKARNKRYQSNPEYFIEQNRRRQARKNNVLRINFTLQQLNQRLSMFGYKCWICGKPYEAIDHVKPLIKDGPHILSNLRPICRSCNSKKGIKWPYPEKIERIAA